MQSRIILLRSKNPFFGYLIGLCNCHIFFTFKRIISLGVTGDYNILNSSLPMLLRLPLPWILLFLIPAYYHRIGFSDEKNKVQLSFANH
jgi:hypothetical protein